MVVDHTTSAAMGSPYHKVHQEVAEFARRNGIENFFGPGSGLRHLVLAGLDLVGTGRQPRHVEVGGDLPHSGHRDVARNIVSLRESQVQRMAEEGGRGRRLAIVTSNPNCLPLRTVKSAITFG